MNLRFTIYDLRVAGLAVAVSGALAAPLAAQNVAIDWFTIDGGGGDSTGGPYTISATIGQSDAGMLTGGSVIIEGGFWPGVLLASPPRLFIVRSGANATISWSPATSGYVLQENDRLAPVNWLDAPSGGANPVSVPLTGGSRYYRLVRQ